MLKITEGLNTRNVVEMKTSILAQSHVLMSVKVDRKRLPTMTTFPQLTLMP